MPSASPALATLLASCMLWVAGIADRRVVDVAEAGDAHSEAAHGYAGHDASAGVAEGRPYRRTRGWMRYALATFDDTEVTVELVFAADTVARHYDVVVEDSLVASRTLAARSATAGTSTAVAIRVPFAVTKGRPHIAVVIRARDGVTPALRELRTVQDHNEL